MNFYENDEYVSIEDIRALLRRVVDYYKSVPYYRESVEVAFCKTRAFSWEDAERCECFFVDPEESKSTMPEWMCDQSLHLISRGYMIYAGRLVYPVKDVKGQIMGLCGWDKFVKPKYLDSHNYGYKAKETSLYGMENMESYYLSNRPVFVTEGPVCRLYLISKGFQALALLGSNMTPYVKEILKRFGRRLVLVPDADESGDYLVGIAKRTFPYATVLQCKYAKDIDDMRLCNDSMYEQSLISDLNNICINPYMPLKTFIRR